jgi:hypothetical protein
VGASVKCGLSWALFRSNPLVCSDVQAFSRLARDRARVMALGPLCVLLVVRVDAALRREALLLNACDEFHDSQCGMCSTVSQHASRTIIK